MWREREDLRLKEAVQDDESKVEWFQRRSTPKPRKVNLKKSFQFSKDLIHFF